MLNYAGTPPLAAMADADSRQLIAAELRSLIARIDLSMRLIDAANRLLVRSPLPVGTTTSWRNDPTGSAGTIRVARTFRHNSMLCHRLVYETMPGGTPPANRTTLDWCNTRDGWKILSS